MSKRKDEKVNDFGAAYAELEQIVGWFEKEDVDLDEALTKFERGLELASQCKARLKEVENKVVKIKAKFDELEEGAE
jgi:exodeoxyribonuclease VII small subunit